MYAGRFFYQLYFQTPELVESELEADVDRALRCIYFALSGDAPVDEWLKHKPASAGLLDELAAPKPMPAWMSEEDLAVYVAAFEAGGFRGPINRYRAQPIDVPQLESVRGQRLTQPACFIGGERDAVRHFVTGMDMYADPGANCDDFRGSTIIPEAGHWVQQEAPAATNAALEQFFESL